MWIILIIAVIIMISVVKSGNNFRDNAQKIQVGMTEKQVLEIMGNPSFVKHHQDGSYEYVYEKSEWKGALRGGTKTRRMECVFSSSGYLISVGKNDNCDMSGW